MHTNNSFLLLFVLFAQNQILDQVRECTNQAIDEKNKANNGKGRIIEKVSKGEFLLFHALALHSNLQPMSSRDRYFHKPKNHGQTADENSHETKDAPYSGTITYPELQKFGMSAQR